jgi:hypothetical protein
MIPSSLFAHLSLVLNFSSSFFLTLLQFVKKKLFFFLQPCSTFKHKNQRHHHNTNGLVLLAPGISFSTAFSSITKRDDLEQSTTPDPGTSASLVDLTRL